MYRGVSASEFLTEQNAISDALSAIGLSSGRLGRIDEATMLDLLGRAFGMDGVNTPNLVCAMLTETARELRLAHRAVTRGKRNAVVMLDVRDAIRTAAARMDVVAELHRRMLAGYALYAWERTRRMVDKAVDEARRGEGAP